MKKYIHILAKTIFSLILILPIAGITGLLGVPTRELYNTDLAYDFILMLTDIMYITFMMVIVHIIALIALWSRREALSAILVLPITLNVVGFHLVIDGGLLTGGAVLGNLMLIINLYLLWKNREVIKHLTKSQTL